MPAATKNRAQSDDAAWQNLQDAILQERFDDLPELMSAMDFAAFAGESIELIRDAIRNGDIVATKQAGLVAVPKAANEPLVRYRLRENPSARIVPQSAAPGTRRLSTQLDQRVFDVLVDLVAHTGASVRKVVEEALVARWATAARATTHAPPGQLPPVGRPAASGTSSPT